MSIRKRKESADLTVNPGSDVILNITIGNAQIGASVVRFDKDDNALAKGDIRNLRLGTAADLKGKTLKVTTNVLDTNSLTNGIVVTYAFSSCTPSVILYQDEVKTDGDIMSFLLDFNFK
ncbi:hypothetical protein [Chitinophaga qingshengii]|uniref:Cohesin domain-containing protein n=1 Tax=Chitinophaga qingshengii TaxID=1569794 RepID=A0ABR7TGU6_9BACT|nr:hypothetical protein [Chitinophaga qingshengii]MBC9929705.1 hypothetical protein [Chitinophaga qingshengii]